MDKRNLSDSPAYFHLPGLFEFYEFYRVFLPLFYAHREYFYDWCEIGSVYGAPPNCLWGGGRIEHEEGSTPENVLALLNRYNISARLAFSNCLLREEHLADKECNTLCAFFEKNAKNGTGIILYSDLLLDYLKTIYPKFYYISSTTKVLTDFEKLQTELNRSEFSYVVPDFRLNNHFGKWQTLTDNQKKKVEFLCNECCWINCSKRKCCYEDVSYKALGESGPEHHCSAPDAKRGYRFSKAMKSPAFIGIDDIQNLYLPLGFSNFKIEGRGLGSALLLEFILYYMTKPDYQLIVREEIYLENSLDLF